MAPLLAGGIGWDMGERALFWLVPGLLFIFFKTGLNVWGILVEINRQDSIHSIKS